jgi:hypothetical protein
VQSRVVQDLYGPVSDQVVASMNMFPLQWPETNEVLGTGAVWRPIQRPKEVLDVM